MDDYVLAQLRSLMGANSTPAPAPPQLMDFTDRSISASENTPKRPRSANVNLASPIPTPKSRPKLARSLGPAELMDFTDQSIAPGEDYTGVERFGQNALELIKGIPAGAGTTVGAMAKGMPAFDPVRAFEGNAASFNEQLKRVPQMQAEELSELRQAVSQLPPGSRNTVQSAISDLLEGAMLPEDVDEYFSGPGALEDSMLVRGGQKLQDISDILPAAPGFEDSTGRMLGEGLGSVAAGIGTSIALGPVSGGAMFTLAGSGEAMQRAIDDGADEDQIMEAARLGAFPGLTDQIPIEVLLKSGMSPTKWPILAVAAAKVGKQAVVEGLQEGGQEFLQNLIANEVYNPEQELTEGLPGSTGIGAGVGAITEGVNQGARLLAGRKRRGQTQQDDTEPALAEAEDVSKEPVAADGPFPSSPETPAPVNPETVEAGTAEVDDGAGVIPDEDTALLLGAGYEIDDIKDMSSDERQAEIKEARSAGVQPDYSSLSEAAEGAGTKESPAKVATSGDIERASQNVNTNPTEGQKKAGNYAKGHIKLHGMDIAIENPKGSERSGKGQDGKAWSVDMPAAYGDIKRTEGADGDPIDVFIGNNPASERVFVIDQVDPSTGKFDEHKAILGTDSISEALSIYKGSFSDNADARIGGSKEIALDEFKTWARSGDTTQPLIMQTAKSEPKGTPEPTDNETAAFKAYVEDNAAGRLSPEEIAKTLDIDAQQAGRLLAQASARGEIRHDNTSGRYSRKPTQKGERTLMQALAAKGGIRDEGGELKVLGLSDKLLPGQGKLVRASGLTLDEAREYAVEAGYLRDSGADGGLSDSTVRDLLDALDNENRGGRQVTEEAQNESAQPYNREEDERYVENAIQDFADEYSIPIDQEVMERMLPLIIDDGVSVEDAHETAVIRLGQEMEPDIYESQYIGDMSDDTKDDANVSDDIQPDRAPENGSEPETGGQTGNGPGAPKASEASRSEPQGSGQSEEQGKSANIPQTAEPEPSTELGADNKPQTVISGAEKISDKKLAERLANKPLRPDAPQKDANGLFGDDRNEIDLFDDSEQSETSKTNDTASDSDIALSVDALEVWPLTEKAAENSAEIETEVRDIIRSIAGPNVEVLTSPDLAKFADEESAVKRSGGEPGQIPTGAYQSPLDTRLRPIIHIALSLGNDPKVTSAHESWHHLEFSGLVSPMEMAVMTREDKRLRAYVAKHVFKTDQSDPKIGGMPTYEVRAYAFQEYFRRRIEGDGNAGLHTGIRKVFQRLNKMFRRIKNKLASMGYRTTEDIFDAALRGDMKQRSSSNRRRINQSGDLAFATTQKKTTRSNYAMPGEDPALPNWLLGRALNKFLPGQESVITKAQDRFYEVHRLQREVKKALGMTEIPEHQDTYMAESLYYGRAGERLNALRESHVEPISELMKESGVSLEEINDYLYARHAPERNEAIAAINDEMPDGGSGMTTKAAEQLMAKLMQQDNAGALVEAAKMVDGITRKARQTLKSSGLISPETFDDWSNKYKYYVPLRGFENDPDTQMQRPQSGRGFDVRGSEAKQALGRASKAEQPLLFVVQQAEQAIIRAEKNRVGKTFLRFINKHPNSDLFEVTKGEQKRRLNPTSGLVEEYWAQPTFSNDENLFAVKIGGKVTWVKIHHPGIARAMRRLGSENLGTIGAALAKTTRYLAMINTSLNPEFVISNMARDLQTALVNISETEQAGIRKEIVAAIPKAMKGVYRGTSGKRDDYWSKRYGEFSDNGGKISFHSMQNIDTIRTNLEAAFKDQSKLKKGLRGTLQWIDKANGAVENALRLATYDALIKRGYTPAKSSSVARELTVNFNRKGEWGAVINAMYLFFNAALQGNVRMALALYRSKTARKIAMGMIGVGAAMDYINFLIAGEDDDGENFYDKIPAWEKERNFILMIPGSEEGEYLKVPLAYGYNMFQVLGQQIGSTSRGETDPLTGAMNYVSATLNAFMPIGMGASPLQTVTPTLARPFVEIAENKSWFGGPIYPTEYPNSYQPKSSSYFQSISPAYKWMADGMNRLTGGNEARSGLVDTSPEIIEHLMNFSTGGAGAFWLDRLPNTVAGIVTGEEWLPEKTPFVRRVYGKKSEYVDRGTYYDMRDKAMSLRYEIKEFQEDGDNKAVEAARKRDPALTKVIPRFEATEKRIRRINKQRRALMENESLSAEDRKKRMERLDKLKLDAMREARKAYYEKNEK